MQEPSVAVQIEVAAPHSLCDATVMPTCESDSSALTDLSSELSSAPASPKFPTLYPTSYPTPNSSQSQSTYSSSSEQDSRKRRRKDDGDPPRKRKRTVEPKDRKTEYLDVRLDPLQPTIERSPELETLLKVLRKKKKIVVVAGAGISTAAGVPDFRSSNGLFNTLRQENKLKTSGKQLFDASVYQTDASTSFFHDMVRTLSNVVNGAKATLFHHMLATLADEGRLLRLYTQNVDGIDTELEPLRTQIPLPKKGPWPRAVQLHGSLKKMVCAKCGDLRDFAPELFDGPHPPACGSCIDLDKVRTEEAGKRSHGIGKLRPRMVLYNEHNPDAEAIGSIVTSDLRARPDAIIVAGTTMEIPGVQRMVKEMCGVIKDRKDGKCIWINRGPPPTNPKFEDIWDLVVSGDCDHVALLAGMRKWFEEPQEGIRVSDSDAEKAKAKDSGLRVIIKSPKKKKLDAASLPTPLPSPKLDTKVKTGLKLNFKPIAGKFQAGTSSNNAGKAKKDASTAAKPKQKKAQHKKPNPKAGQTTKPTKLNSTYKITKALDTSTRKKPVSEIIIPFDIIPPQSSRANSNGGQFQEAESKIAVRVDAPESPPGRLKRMSEERVSPTGPLPRHMEHILN